jgi:hypothetical protein
MMSGEYPKSGSGVRGLVSSLLAHALVLRWPLRLCGEYLRRRLVSPKLAAMQMPASEIPASAYAGFEAWNLRSRHLSISAAGICVAHLWC